MMANYIKEKSKEKGPMYERHIHSLAWFINLPLHKEEELLLISSALENNGVRSSQNIYFQRNSCCMHAYMH